MKKIDAKETCLSGDTGKYGREVRVCQSEEKRVGVKERGEKFGDKMRGQRERERERGPLTKSFMLHLVSYKKNTRTAHSYFSKHTKAIGSTDFTFLTLR